MFCLFLSEGLYAFQFRGLELQERARSHLVDHRLAELADRLDPEEAGDGDTDSRAVVTVKAFGSAKTPLANEYVWRFSLQLKIIKISKQAPSVHLKSLLKWY